MKFTTFIAQNARWQSNKNTFGNLWAKTTTYDGLIAQLRAVGERYFPERKTISTIATEFCLNYLALKRPTTDSQREVLRHFDDNWQRFLRLKNIFQRKATFPASDTTRLEQIASLIAKCTGFCLEEEQLKDILHHCEYLTNLTQREVEMLPLVVDLYKINYYCAIGYQVFANKALANDCLAKFVGDNANQLEQTVAYAQMPYRDGNLVAMCDVLGNSMLSIDGEGVEFFHKMLVYKCGRNVFDTFCCHQFYQNCAFFASEISKGRVEQQLFLQDGCQVRKTTILHNGKGKCKLMIDIPVECDGERVRLMESALCFAAQNCYVGLAVVCQNKLAHCQVGNDGLSWQVCLLPHQKVVFDVVTVVGKGYQEVANKMAKLLEFGYTHFGKLCGKLEQANYATPLSLTACSNSFPIARQASAKKLTFTYQMGDDDVATFLDNGGHSTTLLKGFVFGVGGEKVYGVDNGRFSPLNCGQFTLDGKLCYNKGKSQCIVAHNRGKNIAIKHHVPQKTVFYLPFERASKVTLQNKTFSVSDGLRNYKIDCCGEIESFTTNGLEFSPYQLRYKFSGNLDAGNCLAICFGKQFECGVVIASEDTTPPIAPLVQESLVSTYLNYVNGKEIFCLNNFLRRPHPLALAGIVYTNAQFVKQYLTKLWQSLEQGAYYDNCGKLQKCQSEFLFDLGCVYYAMLTKDTTFPTAEMKSYINTHLISAKCGGTGVIIQALALLKASQIDGFDKVKCLVKHASLTKEISAHNALNKMAQAIGVLPLEKPSKEYLKGLCADYAIPKNWYYVSQLENLYGLHIVGASLQVCPTAFADCLEEFALNFGGKRIYTTFEKGSTQCMTLNGCQYHQPIDPYTLKQDKNTLVVSY